MAYKGQTIENPVSGEKITFLRTAADTDGKYLMVDLELDPDGAVPGMHVHPNQEERFQILDGEMKFTMGLRRITARPGDVVVVPAGKAHKFENAGETTAHVRVVVTPALDMESLFEDTVRMAEEGRTFKSGMPKPVDLAMFVRRYSAEVRGPGSPGAVQRAMLAPLAMIGERRERRSGRQSLRPVAA